MKLTDELVQHNIHIFLEHYGITNDQGEKLDFRDHPYLWDLFKDISPTQVILKAAQVGLSTLTNIKAMWVAKNKRLDVIYSLPSAADVKEFVAGKTNRLIANNPILLEWTKDKDSIEQKHVGDNVMYFRGTWTERAALSIPADLYISDEVDRSKQEIVAQYESRLQHSKYGWRWYLSNPSVPGNGVDRWWQQSDQKHWFVKCECGYEWYLTMENIKNKDGKNYFACLKCGQELDRRKGRWVRKYKDRNISGYWIPLLICPWVSADSILQKKKDLNEEQFTNYVLGKPYIGKGNVLTQNLFFQNLTDTINPQDARNIIGVDTGAEINYVIGNKYGIYYYNKVNDYSELDKLMQRDRTAIMVIDQGGDIIGPRKLREKYPGRVYLCFFRANQKNDTLVSWNDDEHTVQADRDKCIQKVVDEFTEKRIPIYGTQAEWWDYWLEWSGMYRTSEENALGVEIHHWNKGASGRCDYPFATVYWDIGMSRFMENRASFVGGGDEIGTLGIEASPNHKSYLPKPM